MSQMKAPPPLRESLPWIQEPLIVSAPMRVISTAPLAVAVSLAGGLGFIGAGTDLSTLESYCQEAYASLRQSSSSTDRNGHNIGNLPIGIGVINHLASLPMLIDAISPSETNRNRPPPAAVWFFAPHHPSDLTAWSDAVRAVSYPRGCVTPQIWVQAGSVSEAVESVLATRSDVLVLQGADAGGHGLNSGASFITLIPEVQDELVELQRCGRLALVPHIIAAGGIMDGRGAAAAIALGAKGVCLGTRFLATPEAVVSNGYREEVVRASDGGLRTVRSRVYDALRGTNHWPERFGGRGVLNASWDHWERYGEEGMGENKQYYEKAMKEGDAGWGPQGRMTTYAGTGVGLIRQVKPAMAIVEEVRIRCREICNNMAFLE